MAAPVVKVFENEQKVESAVCDFIEKTAKAEIKDHSCFNIGVSGGSLAKYLCNGLPKITTDWSKWKIFFCDERLVPFDNDDSTYKVYKENLLPKVPELKEENFIRIDPSLSVQQCADDYTAKIKDAFPQSKSKFPKFDMLLLGMGPDGHTCSLFPDHPLLDESNRIIASIDDSPKPPSCRVTMTLPVLNNAKCVVFVSCGEGKSDMIKRILGCSAEEKVKCDQSPLPAARVGPFVGRAQVLYWYLDVNSASLLPRIYKNILFYIPAWLDHVTGKELPNHSADTATESNEVAADPNRLAKVPEHPEDETERNETVD